MRKNFNAIFLFVLVITSEIVFGKEINKSTNKIHKNNKKQTNHTKDKPNIERIKRSTNDEEDKPFWANRGKKSIENYSPYNKYAFDMEKITKPLRYNDDAFGTVSHYGTRNRRDSSSAENFDEGLIDNDHNCKNCFGTIRLQSDKNFKDRRDDALAPFWGNRGRRSSDEIEDPDEPFWGNRGRRQEDEPFWGTRGRRKDSLLWGARARQEDEPFWGNRGRRDDMDPFWGNRGRRQDSEPFWGTRGRRQEDEPFWGNRGRRDDEPFWGNRGRRKESELLWGNRGRKKEDLKESVLQAINLVENDIEQLSRLKRSERSFWANRGRDSKLKSLFNDSQRNRFQPQTSIQIPKEFNLNMKSDPNTLRDSRIYADEPQYILVERSGRSSGESEDPFFISRGKKYFLNYNIIKAARDRRGAIEEIVKSVRNDPYYIARGKKAAKLNSTDDLSKAKELICSAIDMITVQNQNGKVKREIDSDRDRRTILKKLAARLQIDPFPISRGKKNDGTSNENNLHEFITSVAGKCN